MRDLPFVPAWLDDADLTPAEFRVYSHVCRRANGGRGTCHSGVVSIGRACRLHVDTARAVLRRLAARGFIREQKVTGKPTVRTPLYPSLRSGGVTPPSLSEGGSGTPPSVSGGTPPSLSAPPLPSFRPDPPETKGAEGAFEGAFEGATGRECPSGPSPQGDGSDASIEREEAAQELVNACRPVAKRLKTTLTRVIERVSTIPPSNGYPAKAFKDPRAPGVSIEWIRSALARARELGAEAERDVRL